MIKFGISKNYIKDWTVVNAIREVYQNFIDYGEFEVEIDIISDTHSLVTLTNSFHPESWEFLKIGFTQKTADSIGGHGEGLKLAGLVFARNDLRFYIHSTIGTATPLFYDDINIGECYGLDIDNDSNLTQFNVVFSCETKDIQLFDNSYIKPEDVLQTCYYGDILNKPKGNIYVGGLFVCNVDRLKYSFNFKPTYVSLGRDRDFPSTLEIEYYGNQIVNACQNNLNLKASDINNREFAEGSIPSKISSKFKPEIVDGNMRLKSGKTVITDRRMVDRIKRDPIVALRIERLKYEEIKQFKQLPVSILTNLRDELSLSENQCIKFDTIIKLSKNWRVK